jgi:DNA-binding HxlR family transcriptional regulator
MRKREIDGCPISGALQFVGDRWTMLIVRDLSQGPRRTMELINGLFPISSRTLIDRLRDMENDNLVLRHNYGGNPQHIEYELTDRGRLLLPLADMLRELGVALGCHECEDRKDQIGVYCELCPHNPLYRGTARSPVRRPAPSTRRERDDSIVLL